MINEFPVAATTHTGAHHWHLRIQFVIGTGGNTGDDTRLHMGANVTFPAAIKGAAGLHHTLFISRRRQRLGIRRRSMTG
ncbi:MAG: hypothetical protein K0R86_3056 [Enterobacter kobei]|nr:hypothetical protein [Enterobacter kobei]